MSAESDCGGLLTIEVEDGAVYCNATFDSYLCWPPTEAGTTAVQSCPRERLSDPSRNAVRKCGETGIWLGRHDDTSTTGWTNYTPCFTPEVQSVFVKMFEDDEMAQAKLNVAQNTRYMEFVGFSTSILSLITSLIIFCWFGSLSNHRTRIHKSLFTAMLLQSIIRLILYSDQEYARRHFDEFSTNETISFTGIENTPFLCEASYIFLEYLSSVMFMWMFIEGMYLHNVVTASTMRECVPFLAFYVVAWGVPLIFTGIWAAITAYHYSEETMKTCWYGYNFSSTHWIVEAPRLAVILVNMVFLLNIMRVLIVKLRQTRTSEMEKVRKAVRAALVLLPLLGITNFLNIVEVDVDAGYWKFAIWSYVTHFLRSFQGYFIALIYCFMNGEVRAAIKKYYRNFMAMRAAARRSRSRVRIGQRYVRRNEPEVDSTWIQMTRLRMSNIYSTDGADYDSDSEPSFVPPCPSVPREVDSSDEEGAVANAAITVVTQAEVNVECETKGL